MHHFKPISEFFVDSIGDGADSDNKSLMRVLHEICQRFELSHVTYFGRSISSNCGFGTVLLTTYSEDWVAHYFERKYQEIDPVVSFGRNSLLPIQWAEIPRQGKSIRDFFGEADEFGVGRQGVTVSVRGLGADYALMSFNKDCQAKEWQSFCLGSLPDLNYLAYLFHARVVELKNPEERQPRCRLTMREAETLRWAARGKTAWETATILGLSEKTVNFYIANACTKLGVASKTQAVATVISERLILL